MEREMLLWTLVSNLFIICLDSMSAWRFWFIANLLFVLNSNSVINTGAARIFLGGKEGGVQ